MSEDAPPGPTVPSASSIADTAASQSYSEANAAQEGIKAFANQIFTLIGHEDVGDITALQAEMYALFMSYHYDFLVEQVSLMVIFAA